MEGADVSELDEFLDAILPRQVEAETAMHNGDVEPRLEMWTRQDPVTLLGVAGVAASGTSDVSDVSRWAASRFADCTAYSFELIAAGVSGDLAYTVGYEHSTRSIDGNPRTEGTVRVTHVYRREDGEWKIVHRHGDGLGTEPLVSVKAGRSEPG